MSDKMDNKNKSLSRELKSSSAPAYLQSRELSWLEFNKRVLDQARDKNVPLLERMNFVSIFWSNLQEFFMVRVGSLSDLELVKGKIEDKKTGWRPKEHLQHIYARCHELYPYYEQTYEHLCDKLDDYGIRNVDTKQLTSKQRAFLDDWYKQQVQPYLSPQIVNSRHPFPHLSNGAIYIIVRLNEKTRGEFNKNSKTLSTGGAKNVTLGIIPLPPQTKRVIELPTDNDEDGFKFILLENLIDMYAPEIFSMYKVKHTNIICVTRNADLDVIEGEEEQGEDYREHMKRILKKRSRLHPVRLESARPLSEVVKGALMSRLELSEEQLFVTKVPLDLSYVYSISKHVNDNKTLKKLTYKPFTPAWPPSIDKNRSVINQLSEREILLSYPYETMDVLVQLLKEAAFDPAVVSIKITLYRLAEQSRIAEALILAAENGKEVTALFELRARFDESNNINWSMRFEEAGANVIYGFADYKVHSKICCITRNTPSGTQYITQLGTGNYNEKTAKLYTDFSFMTSDRRIGEDAIEFFTNMQMETLSDDYDILQVAPLQIKKMLMKNIDEQIKFKKEGRPSGIFLKTNSITDLDIINKLVEASQAGVQITLLVRGISCVLPNIKGFTENIYVVSIVGRLLEHSRIYCFGSLDTSCKLYLSSADLMTRNLDKRVEIAWPVENLALKGEIIKYIGECIEDNEKLRALCSDGTYTKPSFLKKKNDKSIDSQEILIARSRKIEGDVFEEEETKEKKSSKKGELDSARTNIIESRKPEAKKGEVSNNPRFKKNKKKSKGKKTEQENLEALRPISFHLPEEEQIDKVSDSDVIDKSIKEEKNASFDSFFSEYPKNNEFKIPSEKKKKHRWF